MCFSSVDIQGSSWPSVMREEWIPLPDVIFSIIHETLSSVHQATLKHSSYWVGQEVHLGFYLNILQKKLNKPFDQPNKEVIKYWYSTELGLEIWCAVKCFTLSYCIRNKVPSLAWWRKFHRVTPTPGVSSIQLPELLFLSLPFLSVISSFRLLLFIFIFLLYYDRSSLPKRIIRSQYLWILQFTSSTYEFRWLFSLA